MFQKIRARGRKCPHCGGHTARRPFPLYLRPLRMLWPWLVWRRCDRGKCTWEGLGVDR